MLSSSSCSTNARVSPSLARRSMNKTRTRAARAARTVVSALPSLPLNTKEQIEQAAGAIEAALRDGKTTQAIELNLPLIGATDLDDWPGGIRQQYGALAPMVSEVLRLINAGAEGTCQQRVIDDADAVAALTLGSDVVVSFPTAEVLDDLRAIENKNGFRLKIIANPQWNTKGAIIGDFGFGPWKRRAEEFVGKFEQTYYLKEQRIQGEIVRTLKVYPNKWQVFALAPNENNKIVAEALGEFDERPLYDQLKKLLESREGSIAAMNWVERAKREATFNAKSLQAPPNQE
jgi:hypothetical protein